MWSDGETIWIADDSDKKIYAYRMPPADDISVGVLKVNGEDVAGLHPDEDDHQHGVASSVTQATVVAKPMNRFAELEFDGTDADLNTDGFQVNLSAGENMVAIIVNAPNGDGEGHTLSINRGVNTDFGWRAVDDLDGVMTVAGNSRPTALWSNGTTFWVGDGSTALLYAYDRESRTRDPGKDLTGPQTACNISPWGIWSDGTTMWVSDSGTNAKLHAYSIETSNTDSAKDFNTLVDAGNRAPQGLWSDGVTMWVSDWSENKIYAYDMETKAPDPDKNFNTLRSSGLTSPWGIWSNHAVMWVADSFNGKLYSYNMDRPAPNNLAAEPGNRAVRLTWDDPSNATIVKYQFRAIINTDPSMAEPWFDIPDSGPSTTAISFVNTNLTNGKEHAFQVRAVYSRDGEEVAGNHAEVRAIPRAPLTEPRSLSPSLGGDGAVTLSWTDPSDASISGYQYRYMNADDTDWNPDWTDAADSDHTTTSVTLSGLTNYTLYVFEIRMVREETTFGPASSVSFTPRGPMTAPANFSASAGEDRKSRLSWDQSNDDSIIGYQYRASPDGGTTWTPDWTKMPGSGWTTNSYTVTGLTNRVTYTFEVRALRADENGPAGDTTAEPEGPPSAPDPPVSITVLTMDGGLYFGWTTPPTEDERAPITSYQVRHSQESSGSWTTTTVQNKPLGARGKHVEITGLTNNTHYTLQVAAVNRLGSSTFASATGTPQPTPEPPPPPPDGTDEVPALNLGQLTAFWTDAYGSDAPHPDGPSNSLYDVCDRTLSFKIFWDGPKEHPNVAANSIADEYEAHITTKGGAGNVTHKFDYEYGGEQYYAMYGTLSVRGWSSLSIQTRSRYSSHGWGTWTKPVRLSCSLESP